jgi:dTDP-4-dehydrorhamnose 3,5-epimerase
MKFIETGLKGAFIIEIERLQDHRGFFARTWCQREFNQRGIDSNISQSNTSYNVLKGTLRGMHYQEEPYGETKIVRCTKGVIYDVIIDLRPSSLTYRKWIGIELTEENFRMLYVPKVFAHGFQTLQDHTVVSYQVGQFYTPGAERGLRYNDPAFNVKWPLKVSAISEKDKNWPDFNEIHHLNNEE